MCEVMTKELIPEVMEMPMSPDDWKEVAKDFNMKCVGVIDGKHVVIKIAKDSRTVYFNYRFLHHNCVGHL